MLHDLLNSVLLICSITTALLTAKIVFPKSKIPFLQNSGKREKIILAISIIIQLITYFKSSQDEKVGAKKAQEFSDTLHNRENRYNRRIDSISTNFGKLVGASKDSTIEALAKYGLKYDTAQKRIEKLLKDSAGKKIINYNNAVEPSVSLAFPGIILDSSKRGLNYFKVTIANFKGDAFNINADLFIIEKEKNKFFLHPINQNGRLIINGRLTEKEVLSISVIGNVELNRRLFFLLKGSYTNSGLIKKYPINILVEFKGNDINPGPPVGNEDIEIQKFLKSKGI